MSVDIDLQIACESKHLPKKNDLLTWATTAIGELREKAEISVRIVDIKESAALNLKWRNKSGATNILSFPADLHSDLNLPLLGDLVICAPVVEKEAQQQNKTLTAHWAHITIHGTLHLLGYDHVEENQAAAMELLETEIMAALGFANPYLEVNC